MRLTLFEGWPGPEVLPSRLPRWKSLPLYRAAPKNESNPAENAHRVALLGGRAQLVQRPRQVVGDRLDRRVLRVDDGERRRRPRLRSDPLAQGRPRARTVLGGLAIEKAEELPVPARQLAQERVVSDDASSIGALVGLKLLIQPAATALLAFYVFDVPPLWSKAAVLLSSLPIGSGPFTIAKLYGLEAGVTSGAILISHLFSVATVSILVAWLG